MIKVWLVWLLFVVVAGKRGIFGIGEPVHLVDELVVGVEDTLEMGRVETTLGEKLVQLVIARFVQTLVLRARIVARQLDTCSVDV